jgi:hypothetical protein
MEGCFVIETVKCGFVGCPNPAAWICGYIVGNMWADR